MPVENKSIDARLLYKNGDLGSFFSPQCRQMAQKQRIKVLLGVKWRKNGELGSFFHLQWRRKIIPIQEPCVGEASPGTERVNIMLK